MDAADELATLKLLVGKLERELREARANLTLAESAERVATHARDAMSAELAQLRRLRTDLLIAISPLSLLLRQMEQSPGDVNLWAEVHGLAQGAVQILERQVSSHLDPKPEDEADTDPTIRSPFPEAAPHAPFPPSPSARLPPPPRLPALRPSSPPKKDES